MVNKNLLVSKMKLYGDTQADLAKELGISIARLNAKINETDGAEFWQGEISIIRDRYQLTAEEVDLIFFSKNATVKGQK